MLAKTPISEQTKVPHPMDIIIGGNIRQLRNQHGYTQEKLAEKLGITFQQIQKYEKGTNRTSASKITEICIALNVSLADIFAGTEIEGATAEPLLDPQAVKLAKRVASLDVDQIKAINGIINAITKHNEAAA